jgi:hypothetical protein
MIKVNQMAKKDTKFLDKLLSIFGVKVINFSVILYKNYLKPLIILGFSCINPIMILLAPSQRFIKIFYSIVISYYFSHTFCLYYISILCS